MKYFCNTNQKMTASRIEAIKTLYPRIKFIESFDEMLCIIKKHDEVVFDNITELDLKKESDISEIKKNYKALLDKQVYIIFDKSPNCDSIILNETYQNYIDNGVIFESKDKAMKLLLETQIEAYINFRDAIANAKKFSQWSANKIEGKSYGRPVGSGKETEKAKKAKEIILRESKYFNGTLSDEECIKLSGASRKMYYVYKKQLKKEGGK